MTLKDYCAKYGFSYTSIAKQIKKPVRTVTHWADVGHKVKTNGKALLAIYRPATTVWASDEYNANKSGVDQ